MLFRINWQSQTEIPANVLAEAEAKANSPDSSAIYITSGDDERYLCSIPDVATTVSITALVRAEHRTCEEERDQPE